ncbi:CMD domain-containing protein [Taklimakanibacter lacteus]|uniref:CMD domain-containing protein n=1 Tax=Taklimakanibacter lacteus TaxID=2268456 RepID=UPI000E66A760
MTDLLLELARIAPESPLAAIAAKRGDVFELTQKTHDAALRPLQPGGLSHGLRAALACRIAALNGDAPFLGHFRGLLDEAKASEDERKIAELSWTGGDDRSRALIRHTDLVASEPKKASGADIRLLCEAGIAEADIVRLSELIAFVSYQIRVVAGLRLLKGAL